MYVLYLLRSCFQRSKDIDIGDLSGTAYFYTYDTYGLSDIPDNKIKTQGGSSSYLKFHSPGCIVLYEGEGDYEPANRTIPDRYARIKLKKGKTIIIEVSSSSRAIMKTGKRDITVPLKLKLTVKKK